MMINMAYLASIFLLLLFLATSKGQSNHKMDLLLAKYFSTSRPSFFVSIQDTQDTSLLHKSAFQQWLGIRVTPTQPQQQYQIIKSENILEVHFSLSERSNQTKAPQNQESHTPTITLQHLCDRYFIQKPKILQIDIEALPLRSIQSSFWDQSICIPQFLLIRDREDINNYLKTKKMVKKQSIGGLTIYIHEEYAKEYATNFQKSNLKISEKVLDQQYNTSIGDLLQKIRGYHPSQGTKKDYELLSIYNINSKIVSLSDIVGKMSYQTKYLLLRGYSQAENMIIVGDHKTEYKISNVQVKNTLVLNLTLLNGTSILIPQLKGQNVKIFQQGIKLIKCQENHVDQQVHVVIRGTVGGLNPEAKNDNYIQQSQSKHEYNAHQVKINEAQKKTKQTKKQATSKANQQQKQQKFSQVGSKVLRQQILDPFLMKYFASRKTGFYVSIQSSSEFSVINPYIFQQWHGLRVFPSNPNPIYGKIKSQQITQANFILSDTSNTIIQDENGPLTTITLQDLCKKFFIKKPTYLSIQHESPSLSIIKSSFWNNQQCYPQVLTIKAGSELKIYLQSKGMVMKHTYQGYMIFVHQSFAASYGQNLDKGNNQNANSMFLTQESNFTDFVALIKLNHPEQAAKKDSELLAIYDINTKIVSIPDIIQKETSQGGKSKYIMLRGYSSAKNMIIIGRSNSSYKVQTKKRGDKPFLNISLFDEKSISYLLIPLDSKQKPVIFQEQISKMNCPTKHVDQQVFVNIRGQQGSLDASIKDNTYIDQTSQQQNHETFNHYMKFIKSEAPEQLKNENQTTNYNNNSLLLYLQLKDRFYVILLIALVVLLVFLVIGQILRKRAFTQNLKNKSEDEKVEIVSEHTIISQIEESQTDNQMRQLNEIIK